MMFWLTRSLRFMMLFGAIVFCLMLALWVAILQGLRLASLRHRQFLTHLGLASMSFALPFKVRIIGSAPKQSALWLANHISWTDILLLGRIAPLSFLSKIEVRHWPVAGWLAQQAGTVFIRRGSASQDNIHQQLTLHLQAQQPLLIFPEGTTTDGKTVGLFHSRLLECALATQTPIQPVAICYRRDGMTDPIAPFIGDDDLLAHLKRLFAHPAAEVEIHLLPLIDTKDGSRTQIARQARLAIRQQVELEEARETALSTDWTPSFPSRELS